EALFFGEFRESNQSEVTLEDVTVEGMRIILNIVYYNQLFHDKTIKIVLKLADRFGMQNLLAEAENYIQRYSGLGLHQKFFLADRFHLPLLLDDCMTKLNTRKKIRELKKEDKFADVSASVKEELLDKSLKLKP
ncbi:hypothetical protein PFISCL1PPCAC_21045, partial [Pristionchus fissidentatus]